MTVKKLLQSHILFFGRQVLTLEAEALAIASRVV
jgi:hypothetical protein